jgi:hypothetical protein
LARLVKDRIIEVDRDWIGARRIGLRFDPLSLVPVDERPELISAVATRLAIEHEEYTRSEQREVTNAHWETIGVFTPARCVRLDVISPHWWPTWLMPHEYDEVVALYRTPKGDYIHRTIVVYEDTFEVEDGLCVLLSEVEAAALYKRAPADAPECLRSLATSRFDLSAAPTGEPAAPARARAGANRGPVEGTSLPQANVEDLAVSMWFKRTKAGETPSVSSIARAIGCNRGHLHRCPGFMAIIHQQRGEAKARRRSIHSGRKDQSRIIDAVDSHVTQLRDT